MFCRSRVSTWPSPSVTLQPCSVQVQVVTVHRKQYIEYSVQHKVYNWSQSTENSAWSIVYNIKCHACCTLYTACCTLHSAYCALYTAYCTLQNTIKTILHTSHFTLHTKKFHPTNYTPHTTTAHCTLHTVHCALHDINNILHTEHRTLHTSHCTMQTTYCTPHTSHCTVHIAHCKTSHYTLCSSVINPVIYGFFNENFRREFLLIRDKVGTVGLARCKCDS